MTKICTSGRILDINNVERVETKDERSSEIVMDTKLTFVISTYDAASFLNRCLDSILSKQTDSSFDVVVVNSNSPGTDRAVAEKWIEHDKRVRLINQDKRTNYGVSWLTAWEQIESPFWVNLNTDDFCYPNFVEVFDDHMDRLPKSIGFMYAGLDMIDESGRLKARSLKSPYNRERYSYQCEGGCQLAIRNHSELRERLDWALMYERAAQHHSAFDYWTILYLMSLGFDGYAIQQILTIYTQRPGSIENSCYGGESTYETLASISEFFPHHFKNRLSKFKEFFDFGNLPPKDEWVAARKAGKKWRG